MDSASSTKFAWTFFYFDSWKVYSLLIVVGDLLIVVGELFVVKVSSFLMRIGESFLYWSKSN